MLLLSVLCLFLVVPLVATFPGHTHLLFVATLHLCLISCVVNERQVAQFLKPHFVECLSLAMYKDRPSGDSQNELFIPQFFF